MINAYVCGVDMQMAQRSWSSVAILSNRSHVADFMLQLEHDVQTFCDCGAYIGWYVHHLSLYKVNGPCHSEYCFFRWQVSFSS